MPESLRDSPTARALESWSASISMPSQISIRRADTEATEYGVMEHHKTLASNNPNKRSLLDLGSVEQQTVRYGGFDVMV